MGIVTDIDLLQHVAQMEGQNNGDSNGSQSEGDN